MITDYKFNKKGDLTITPTKDNFDRIIIQESELAKINRIKPKNGNYDENGNIVYKTNKGVIINVDDKHPTKKFYENDASKTGEKSIGTKFTITDNKIADDIFKAITANSDVEYGIAKYDNQGKIYNDIWTSKQEAAVLMNPVLELAKKHKILESSHSHPMRSFEKKQGTLQ